MVLDLPTVVQSTILLFIVTDPLGNVPIFYSVTRGIKKDRKSQTIQSAILTAFIVLMGFALVGNKILGYFNVSFDSFRIAGGVLLFFIGFQMVAGKIKQQFDKSQNFGVVPLGVPLIAGPGAITMTIIISQTHGLLTALTSVLLSMIFMSIVLGYCERIVKSIGTKSSETLTRIMGIILAVIAVQLIIDGLQILF